MPVCEVCCEHFDSRFICYDHEDAAEKDYRPRRCWRCHIEHKQQVHGVVPEPKKCTGCKKDLGLVPPGFSYAGAPWCGECPKWWNG